VKGVGVGALQRDNDASFGTTVQGGEGNQRWRLAERQMPQFSAFGKGFSVSVSQRNKRRNFWHW